MAGSWKGSVRECCRVDVGLVPVKATYFFIFAGLAVLIPYIPVYAHRVGLSPLEVAVIFGSVAACSAPARVLVGAVADKLRRHAAVVMVCCTLAGALHFALLWVPRESGIRDAENSINQHQLLSENRCSLSSERLQARCDGNRSFLAVCRLADAPDSTDESQKRRDGSVDDEFSFPNSDSGSVAGLSNRTGIFTESDCLPSNTARWSFAKNCSLRCCEESVANTMQSTYAVIPDNKKDLLNRTESTKDRCHLIQSMILLDADRISDQIRSSFGDECHRYSFKTLHISASDRQERISTDLCDVIENLSCRWSCPSDDHSFPLPSSRSEGTPGPRFGRTFWSFYVVFFLAQASFGPVLNIVDALAFVRLGVARRDQFGQQRLWGTLGFVGFVLVSGVIIDASQYAAERAAARSDGGWALSQFHEDLVSSRSNGDLTPAWFDVDFTPVTANASQFNDVTSAGISSDSLLKLANNSLRLINRLSRFADDDSHSSANNLSTRDTTPANLSFDNDASPFSDDYFLATIDTTTITFLFPFIAFFVFIFLGGASVCLYGASPAAESTQTNVLSGARGLCATPRMLSLLFTMLVAGVLSGAQESYLWYFCTELGATRLLMGITMFVACIAEVIVLFASGRIIAIIGRDACFLATFAVFSARFFAYSLMEDVWAVVGIELMHCICFGLLYPTATAECASLAPTGLEGTAQGLVATVYFGVGRAVGAAVGGVIYEALGARAMFRVFGVLAALYAAVLLAVVLVARWRRRQPKRPLADCDEEAAAMYSSPDPEKSTDVQEFVDEEAGGAVKPSDTTYAPDGSLDPARVELVSGSDRAVAGAANTSGDCSAV